jgi:hypothetical protein
MVLNVFTMEMIFNDAMHPRATISSKPGASISFFATDALSPIEQCHDLSYWRHGRQHSSY